MWHRYRLHHPVPLPLRSARSRGSSRGRGRGSIRGARGRDSGGSRRLTAGTRDVPDLRKGVAVSVCPALILHGRSDPVCGLLAVDLCDPGKRDVDASRDARRRPDVAVFNPAGGGDPFDVGACGYGPGPGALVGCGLFAVEDAGAREDRRARADGDDVFQLRGGVSWGGCCWYWGGCLPWGTWS